MHYNYLQCKKTTRDPIGSTKLIRGLLRDVFKDIKQSWTLLESGWYEIENRVSTLEMVAVNLYLYSIKSH